MINKKNEQNQSNGNFNINQENIKNLKKKILIDNNNNIQTSDIQNHDNIQLNMININNSKSHNQKKNKRQNNYSNLNQINSAFDNYDLQKLTYSLIKDYSLIQINKDEKFLDRMKFDIYKRQSKDERINKLIEENKKKIDEVERIKTFNRLIEDANRRNEANENLKKKEDNLNHDIISPKNKKYNDNEWNNIYQKRFKSYENKTKEKLAKNRNEENEKLKKKEQEEINMCKTKKASLKHIEETAKKMYEESKKRKIKKFLLIDFDNEPMKYKKTFSNINYKFNDDDDINEKNKKFNNINIFSSNKISSHINYKKNKSNSLININKTRFENDSKNYLNKSKNNNNNKIGNSLNSILNNRNHQILKYNYKSKFNGYNNNEASKIVNQFFLKNKYY